MKIKINNILFLRLYFMRGYTDNILNESFPPIVIS